MAQNTKLRDSGIFEKLKELANKAKWVWRKEDRSPHAKGKMTARESIDSLLERLFQIKRFDGQTHTDFGSG